MIQPQTDTIELADNYTGTFVVKTGNSNDACIFKVKSNMQEALQVRPAHGIIKSHGQIGKVTFYIRYKGKITDIDKIKLKIYWFSIPCSQLPPELKSSQFTEYYKKCRQEFGQRNQQSLTLPFTFKHVSKQQSIHQFRYKQGAVSSQIPQNKNDQPEKKSEEFIASNNEEPKMARTKKFVQEKPTQNYNLKGVWSVLCLTLLAFFLGLTFGIKFARLPKEATPQ